MRSSRTKAGRVNRTKLSIIDLHDNGSEVRFCRRQSARKRLEGLELLRQSAHAYDPLTARLPRHFIALRQLLKNKRASGRLKDLADVEALTPGRPRKGPRGKP